MTEKRRPSYHDHNEDEVDTWLGELLLAGYKVKAVKHGMGISVELPDGLHFFMHWHARQPRYRVIHQGDSKHFEDLEAAAEFVNELLRGNDG